MEKYYHLIILYHFLLFINQKIIATQTHSVYEIHSANTICFGLADKKKRNKKCPYTLTYIYEIDEQMVKVSNQNQSKWQKTSVNCQITRNIDSQCLIFIYFASQT